MRVLGLALYGERAASTRHRLGQYREGLLDAGIELDVCHLLSDRYLVSRFEHGSLPIFDMLRSGLDRVRTLGAQSQYDCAIVHCELFPLLPGFIESRLLRIPYVYDFDDAFFLKYRLSRYKPVSLFLGDKFDSVIKNAAAVTAGNEFLADHVRGLNPNTTVMPTVVDERRYRGADRSAADVFTVGWIGSPTTSPYLDIVREPLSKLGAEAPVRFVVVGANVGSIPNVDVVNLPWSESTEIGIISSFDVGIMPLPDSDWARGKCAFKLIQYMACGVPSIASPVGANTRVLTTNCGLFARTSEEWIAGLKRMRDDLGFREMMSRNAQDRALAHYTISQNLPGLVSLLESVSGA